MSNEVRGKTGCGIRRSGLKVAPNLISTSPSPCATADHGADAHSPAMPYSPISQQGQCRRSLELGLPSLPSLVGCARSRAFPCLPDAMVQKLRGSQVHPVALVTLSVTSLSSSPLGYLPANINFLPVPLPTFQPSLSWTSAWENQTYYHVLKAINNFFPAACIIGRVCDHGWITAMHALHMHLFII